MVTAVRLIKGSLRGWDRFLASMARFENDSSHFFFFYLIISSEELNLAVSV